jgi:cytochrome c oxidase subunit 2
MRMWVIGSAVALLMGSVAGTIAAQDGDALRARGKQLFVDQGCYGCHTIGKFGTPIAPDLSHAGSKYTVGALTRWLEDPSAQKPTAHMPKIGMSPAESEALAAYLGSLK